MRKSARRKRMNRSSLSTYLVCGYPQVFPFEEEGSEELEGIADVKVVLSSGWPV